MRDDEQMDRRIDAALRSYAAPGDVSEPRVALARVLARAREERVRRLRRWVWAAMPACALLVAAIVGAWMLRTPRTRRIAWSSRPLLAAATPAKSATPVNAQSLSIEIRHAASLRRSKVTRASSCRTATLPKLDVFPTPRPLSPQEQALVAFVRQAPPGLKQAVMDDQQHWDEPMIAAEAAKGSLADDNQQHQKSNLER